MAREDTRAIEAAIPHRAPFLFVDRILSRTQDSIVTEWDVPVDGAWFKGHYPGEPVLPGVLICEFSFQSGAILLSDPKDPRLPVLVRIEDARFKKIVRPGERLRAEVKRVESVGPRHHLSARVFSDAQRASSRGERASSSGELASWRGDLALSGGELASSSGELVPMSGELVLDVRFAVALVSAPDAGT